MDKLIEKIVEKQNPTVAGLDPKLSYIPEHIRSASYEKYGKTLEGAADALLQFNKGLIDALCDVVPAVKPQAAYYEMYGWQGVKALTETIAYAKSKGMFVITDGKRNDIGRHHDCLRRRPPGLHHRGRGDLRALRRGRPHCQRLPGHRRYPAPGGGVR